MLKPIRISLVALLLTLSAFTALSQSSATFLGVDRTTQGNWRNAYGARFVLVGCDSFPPSFTVTPSNVTTEIWAPLTNQPAALQLVSQTNTVLYSPADRIAAAWTASNSFSIGIQMGAQVSRRIAIYCLDWNGAGRSQTVELLDAGTSQRLDLRTINNFAGGAYLVWNVTGPVRLVITRQTGPNAVVSGLFFDNAPQPSPAEIQQQPVGATLNQGGSFSLSAFTRGAPPLSFQWRKGGSAIAGATSPVLLFPSASGGQSGSYTLVVSNAYGTATSTVAPVTVLRAKSSASFAGTDRTLQGSWKGVRGKLGTNVFGDLARMPAGVSLTAPAATELVWAASTSQSSALAKASVAGTSDRIAAAWTASGNLVMNLALPKNQRMRVSLYFLDWDTPGQRVQDINVLDVATGAVLDTRRLTGFGSGAYLTWEVRGPVRFEVVSLAGNLPAVASGCFLDRSRILAPLDFDGDLKSDTVFYDSAAGDWYFSYSSGALNKIHWGFSSGVPMAADYDGDRKTDYAVYDQNTGDWYLHYSSGGSTAIHWGWNTAVAKTGDFDGDGRADIAAYDPNTGVWYIRHANGSSTSINWGGNGAIPMVGDFDGDGKTDLASYDSKAGDWYIRYANGSSTMIHWGWNTAVPLVADFDADGAADLVAYDRAAGDWYIRFSKGGSTKKTWGWDTATPLVRDFDGDGITDLTVFDPAGGDWYVWLSSGGMWKYHWGWNGVLIP